MVSGYSLVDGLSDAQKANNSAALANAKYGSTVTLSVKSAKAFSVFGVAGNDLSKTTNLTGTGLDATSDVAYDKGTLANLRLALTKVATGKIGDKISRADVLAAIKSAGADKFVVVKQGTTAISSAKDVLQGKVYTATQYTLDDSALNDAYYTVQADGAGIPTLTYTAKAGQENSSTNQGVTANANNENILARFNFNY
ncbi:hypothetical protein [Secundilactobacillus kimchicus]|uniref:Uncharacterized protein n=1 Tax=Secundilactobacillus kimchicus JCM 15530 TaxID=1302272 RepID=A0A0R1HNQ4_9LACO|nr:hypothetical protein [Secundilactobacillus kimchicus]KRK48156.1 hypothetical protein FC96_GL001891 [Secundilactobacillus kimchicus JCM 15530]